MLQAEQGIGARPKQGTAPQKVKHLTSIYIYVYMYIYIYTYLCATLCTRMRASAYMHEATCPYNKFDVT